MILIHKRIVASILCAASLLYPSSYAAQLTPAATEAARILNVQNEVNQLLSTSKDAIPTDEILELQLHVIRKVLGASLEVRKMADQIEDELTTEYTARNELMARRDSRTNLTNSAIFIQDGVFSEIIGGQSLHGLQAQPNELAIVSAGTTLSLVLLSLWQSRGGSSKRDAHPNMLGEIFNKNVSESERLPHTVWEYMNSVPPDATDGLTRREWLKKYWKKQGALSINLDKKNNIDKLTAMGPGYSQKCETIKLINNRIYMLNDVERTLETLDIGLVELLTALD